MIWTKKLRIFMTKQNYTKRVKETKCTSKVTNEYKILNMCSHVFSLLGNLDVFCPKIFHVISDSMVDNDKCSPKVCETRNTS